jgi:hypothetical protein
MKLSIISFAMDGLVNCKLYFFKKKSFKTWKNYEKTYII